MPTAVRCGAESLKSSHRMGMDRFFKKISPPHPSMTTFRLTPLSTSFISQNSTFKVLAKSSRRTIHLFKETYSGKSIHVASPLNNVVASLTLPCIIFLRVQSRFSDPDSVRSVDPDPYSESRSGSRRAKIIYKSRKI